MPPKRPKPRPPAPIRIMSRRETPQSLNRLLVVITLRLSGTHSAGRAQDTLSGGGAQGRRRTGSTSGPLSCRAIPDETRPTQDRIVFRRHPSASRGQRFFRRARYVPFWLPRSSTVTSAASTTMRACRRETPGTSKRMWASSARPRIVSPARSAMLLFPQTNHPLRPEGGDHLRRIRSDRRAEPIAKPPHRPHKPGPFCIVGQHLANLGDQNRQASIRHERIRPQELMQLRFRKRPLVMFGQQLQQIEGFWRERHRFAVTYEHAAVGIERPGTKTQPHRKRIIDCT